MKKIYLLSVLVSLIGFSDELIAQTTVTLTTGTSWTVPANVYAIKVECWGGGGAGGGVNAGSRGAAGGGAGGAYASVSTIFVTPTNSISYSIGAGGIASGTTGQTGPGGDTWFYSNTTVLAKGGSGALTISSASSVTSGVGAAGTSAGSIGDQVYAGGSGGNGAAVASGTSNSGGGGSSAGSGSNGNNGATPAGGSAPIGGFAGANGKDAGSVAAGAGNSATGTNYGAGGGGASASASSGLRVGGSGAGGRIIITYYVSRYAVLYNGNGNTSGSVPLDNNTYTSGSSVTVLSNSGSLTKTGYVFSGWNTASNGSGISYSAGNTFSISANTTLYAQWTIVSANLCPSTTAVSPTTTQTLCQGASSNQLTATITNSGTTGTPTLQYQWYYNTSNSNTVTGATAVSGATNSTYTPLTTASEIGTRYYFCVGYATDNSCGQTNSTQSLASGTVQVTVSAPVTPSLSITSNPAAVSNTTTICSGTSVTFTAAPSNLGGGTAGYQWKLDGSDVGTNSVNYTSTTLANTNVISCVMTITGGCVSSTTVSSNNSITMVVNPTPANDLCANSTALTVGAAAVNGNFSCATPTSGLTYGAAKNDIWYKFSPSCTVSHTITVNFTGGSGADVDVDVFTTNCPASGTAPTIGHSTNSSSETVSATFNTGTTYYIRVLDYTGNASGINIQITSSPLISGVITGSATPCTGTSTIYSIAAGTNVTSYAWSLPSGWVITNGATTNSITVTPSATTGDISVTASNCYGSSSAITLTSITPISTPATPGVITGATLVCPGSAQTYLVTNDPTVTNYNWTQPSGWTGTSTLNSIDYTVGTAGGNVQVTATNGCGTSTASTLAVSMLTSPTAPTAIAATNTDVASFTANWNAVPGATGYYVDVYSVSVATDLIISEYVEGSNNNKYIEIYNGTGAAVNLSNYRLRLYANGASTPTNDVLLSGTLNNNATIVYENSGATIFTGTRTANAAVNFNGDDAVVLYKVSPAGNVDIFGRIGEDPGTAWTGGSNSTLDRTLRRNSPISSGVTVNPTSGFPTLATEWTSYPIDNIANLGAHTFSGGFITGYQNIYTTNNFLNVTNLVGNTTYYYVVRADNGSCTSVNSNQISVTTTTCAASPHTVTSVLPASGPANTRVTITGTGFTNVTSLKMGSDVISNFTVLNSTTIVAKIPSDAVTGSINVYNNGCPKASPTFTVLTSSANCGGGSGIATDLFISEIFDSETGSRSYIELYNGTSAPIDLSAYKLKIYTGATVYVSLSGTIAVGGTVVVRIGSTGTDCTGFTYLDRSSVSGFNDNDEVDLYKGSTLVDAVLTPNEVGYSMVRNTATGAPSTSYNSSQWTNTTVESCGNLGTTGFTTTPLLTINSSPTDVNGCPSGTITFTVVATANPSPVTSYTWYYNDSTTMTGWQTVSAGLGIAGNLATLTLPANFASLYNYQFYCEVTKTNGVTCTKYTNAAQFSYPTRPYYKANTAIASAGEWTTPASWLMSDDNTTFVAACTYPVAANSNSVQIPVNMGIKHSQAVTFSIDQIAIDAGGQLEIGTGNSQSQITILDGNTSGADLTVNGTLYDRAKSGYGIKMDVNNNNVVNTGEGTWLLGANGTIIKTNLSSAGEYRDMYYNGILNIPATATWVYRHNGDNVLATPLPFASSTAATAMYYPNLTLENTVNGNTLSSLPNAADINLSDFTLIGANNPVIIQGNFNIGGSGPGNIKFVNANTNGLVQVKKDITIRAGSTFTNNATPNTTVKGAGIDLKGHLTVDGTLDNTGGATTGLLRFSATGSDQTITASASGVITLQDMTNDNTGGSLVNIDKSISIAGVLTLSDASNLRLLSGYTTLKSTATATARVAPINSANITYTGVGRFVVERFFPTHRAWRLMTAPVSTGALATDNSFYNSYQAGGNNTAGNAGNGTYVSGASPDPSPTGNGLDITPLNNSSLKTYDVSTNSFKAVPNTRNLKIAGNTFTAGSPDNFGFFMFVRGDRYNNPNWVTPGVPVNVTTLRDTGKLQIKTYTFNATAAVNGYTLVGNPYASPVDFTKVLTNGSTSGINTKFWSWDPNLSAVGAYVLFDGSASYTPVKVPLSATGTIGQTKIIQSKQAVFVQSSSASTPKVVFREVDKDITNNQAAYRPVELPTAPMLASNMYYTENDSTKVLLDGNMVQSAKEFKNVVDFQEDAIKFTNINENFGIKNGKDVMILERRAPFTENDTINYTLSRTSRRKYQLQFLTEKIDGNNLTGYVEDSYLKTSTPINMAGETWTDFEINGEAASADASRFRIVFKKAAQFTSINADMLNEDIAVQWSLLNETNMSYHEVERSTDGIHFSVVGTVNSKGNAAKGDYSLLDLHPATGVYYYRIRSVGQYGAVAYSDVAKVKMMKPNAGMYVFPNPVTDQIIHLQLNKAVAGVYNARLLNAAGQELLKQNIAHAGGSGTHEIRPQQSLVNGAYELQVVAPDKKTTVIKVLVQ